MAKTMLIANMQSRSGRGWASCEGLVRDREDIDVRSLQDNDIAELIRNAVASGCETVIAAGGDGTISAVAHVILTLGVPVRLGVIPTGTLNHFAKDLGVPDDPIEALRTIDEGHSRLVDVGKVNDRFFINNSSIGLYPFLVRQRERLQRVGFSKWFALARVIVAQPLHRFSVTVRIGAKGSTKTTANMFVGNNAYVMDGLSTGARTKLDEGTLFVALLRSASLGTLLRIAAKTFTGHALADQDLDVVGLTECVVDSDRRSVLVAYDGEVAAFTPPLTYTTVPRSLRVIAPAV